jgi:hypothetical protein
MGVKVKVGSWKEKRKGTCGFQARVLRGDVRWRARVESFAFDNPDNPIRYFVLHKVRKFDLFCVRVESVSHSGVPKRSAMENTKGRALEQQIRHL